MNREAVVGLVELCSVNALDYAKIEEYITSHALTSKEITYAAIRLCDQATLEIKDFVCTKERFPNEDELLTAGWVDLFDIFIRHGLDATLVFCEDGINYENIIQELRYIDNGDTAPVILRNILTVGGDPNIKIDGRSFFEELDFDVIFDVVELNDKRLFDIQFRYWLVMMGFGGYIKEHVCPVKMTSGYSQEIFQEFEKFDYRIEFIPKGWIMHIFNKKSGIEVAVLK